jgi:transcriptional regulator with XRE-family HTH domain
MSSRLPKYLKSYRKRSGLSQDEVAFLLGCASGAKVSRYERFARQPNWETVAACEVVFRAPMRDLLAGGYQKVEETVHQRAQILAEKLNAGKPDRMTRRKRAYLMALTSPVESESSNYGIFASR